MGIQAPGYYELPDDVTLSSMYSAIAQLRADALQAATDVTLTTSWDSFFNAIGLGDGTNNGQSAALSFAGNLQKRIETLGWRIQDVEAGAWSSAEWFQAATLFHDQLAGIRADIAGWSFEGLGTAYVKATGEDAKAKVETVMKVAASLTKPWVLIAIGAAVLLFILAPEIRALERLTS